MTDIDHRPFTIPLFTLGAALLVAGLLGLVVAGTTDLATNNPGGAAATGAILLFGAYAVAALLQPASSGSASRARTIPGVGAVALVVILVAAVAGGSALGGAARPDTDVGAAGVAAGAEGAAEVAGVLDVESFEGSVQGAPAPGPLAPLGGAGSPSFAREASLPDAARSVRAELHWTAAGSGGAQELTLRIESAEGDLLGSASGASELVVDIDDISVRELRVVVSLVDGAVSTGQEFTVYLSSFAGEVPASYTTHEM